MTDTIPCTICNTPTEMTGTKKCDRCWNIDAGLNSLIQQNENIALEYLLDKTIEAYKVQKKRRRKG